MHRSDATTWVEVVHHREHTLLHLTTVPSVQDNLFLCCYVEYNCCFRVQTEFLVVLNLCLGSVVYDEVRFETFELLCCRTDEHICYEVCLPSHLNDEANCKASCCICTAETINNEETLVRKLLLCEFLNNVPSFLACFVVVVGVLRSVPPQGVVRSLIINDELILRRTARVNASHYVYSTEFCLMTYFEALEACFRFLFKQLFVRRIVNDLRCTGNTVLGQI